MKEAHLEACQTQEIISRQTVPGAIYVLIMRQGLSKNTLLKGKEALRVFSACPEPQNDIDSHNSCHRSEENALMQTFTAGQDQT